MRDKKEPDGESVILLGRSSDFEGDLKFHGNARIDGRFKGNISGEGTLEIGKEGKIEADIHTSHIVIYGEIRGKIIAEEKIEIKVPGKVFGAIEAPVIVIDPGAVFQGECQTQQPKIVDKEELEMKSSVKTGK